MSTSAQQYGLTIFILATHPTSRFKATKNLGSHLIVVSTPKIFPTEFAITNSNGWYSSENMCNDNHIGSFNPIG